jgi:phosphatidylserine decarboxylase
VNSSDSYCLPSPTQPVRNVQALNSFWLKDDNYSLYDMFGVNRMGPEVKRIVDESFVGGTVYQAFLSPWCYHRWHAPYSGTIEQTYKLNGTYLLENPTSDLSQSGEDNYVNTQPLLTSLSVRHVYILNTEDPLIGRIGVIEIGMGEVSSCISTVNPGDYMKKGQELGRFEFGGSSHALIFDRRANLEFNPRIYETDAEGPVLQKVNSWLARIKPSTK